MNSKLIKGLMALVLLVVSNIGIFLLGENFGQSFWISYVFAMVAAFITIYVEIFYLSGEELIHRYPLSAITGFYLGVALLVAFLFGSVFVHSPLNSFLIQLFILALYIVTALFSILHTKNTKEQQTMRAKDIISFKHMLNSMKAVLSGMEYMHPCRKIVEHAYDSLASGQVLSDMSVMEQEQQLLSLIGTLSEAVKQKNHMKIEETCKKIEEVSEERKRRLEQRIPF